MRLTLWIALFSLALVPLAAVAQSAAPQSAAAPHTVDDLAWIAGQWAGEGPAGECEEHWSGVAGGAMMGMFRWLKPDDSVMLYEFFLIESSDDGPIMRLKHFSPGLDGWEAKDDSVDFTLHSLEGQKAVFLHESEDKTIRLTYHRQDDSMNIELVSTEKGQTQELLFEYERQ